MKEHHLKCLAVGCDKQVVGIACDDPNHQAEAADAIADMNGGVPSGNPAGVTDRRSVADNHLIERPPGMPIAAWNGS